MIGAIDETQSTFTSQIKIPKIGNTSKKIQLITKYIDHLRPKRKENSVL